MRLLLDTHAFIWYVENDVNLPGPAKSIISSKENIILISIATLWEIGIKISLNKLTVNTTMSELIHLIKENGFEILPILPEHIVQNCLLEFLHRDPFDRMIIAQGLAEDITIVSKDEVFDSYKVKRLWQ